MFHLDKEFSAYFHKGDISKIIFRVVGEEDFTDVRSCESLNFLVRGVSLFWLSGNICNVPVLLAPDLMMENLFCSIGLPKRERIRDFGEVLYNLGRYFEDVWRIPSLYSGVLQVLGEVLKEGGVKDVREICAWVEELLDARWCSSEWYLTMEIPYDVEVDLYEFSLEQCVCTHVVSWPAFEVEEDGYCSDECVKTECNIVFQFITTDYKRLIILAFGKDGMKVEVFYTSGFDFIRGGDFRVCFERMCDYGVKVCKWYLEASKYGFGVEEEYAKRVMRDLEMLKLSVRKVINVIRRHFSDYYMWE